MRFATSFFVLMITFTSVASSNPLVQGRYIQAGSFSNKENAVKYQKYLQAKTKYHVFIQPNNLFYAVRIGPIDNSYEQKKLTEIIQEKSQSYTTPSYQKDFIQQSDVHAPIMLTKTFTPEDNSYKDKIGTMFPALSGFMPFIAGEGSYTWPQIGEFNITTLNKINIRELNQNQGLGGRASLGFINQLHNEFSYSLEIGAGYYGNENISFTNQNLRVSIDQYGFDLLLGLMYATPKYDLFLKVGPLLMNNQMTFINNTNVTSVLPAIKIGSGYHIDDNLVVHIAWMGALGESYSQVGNNININNVNFGNYILNLNNASLSTLFLGLEHRF